ncbi:MAG: phospholipase D family protein [Alphaproteobacteria bacterium]|nr:phospholipase D family protein [Alphaproteobacteria bacterium]
MKRLMLVKAPQSLKMMMVFMAGALTAYMALMGQNDHWLVSDAKEAHISVCLTPGQNCTSLIERSIVDARKSVFIHAYSFTSEPIANALLRAKEKGVDVIILVDRSQMKDKHTKVWQLKAQGIKVLVDFLPGIAHNKVMIIDDKRVITGSFNWTNAAQFRNAENILMIDDPKTVAFYKSNWLKRFESASGA